MVVLRPYRPDDVDALYRICLLTGNSGADGTAIYSDPKLVGHVYAGPYAKLEPEHAFVTEDDEGVAGYVVGTHDTTAFEERLEADWWPSLRKRYADADGLTEADRGMVGMIDTPHRAAEDLVGPYPAHIHMNLLPRLRGQRIGSKLLDMWIDQAQAAAVRGIHLGASTRNLGGIAFWSKRFTELRRDDGAVWFGLKL